MALRCELCGSTGASRRKKDGQLCQRCRNEGLNPAEVARERGGSGVVVYVNFRSGKRSR